MQRHSHNMLLGPHSQEAFDLICQGCPLLFTHLGERGGDFTSAAPSGGVEAIGGL